MRIIRGIVLAIAVVLTLLGGTANVANASPGKGAPAFDPASASADPGDPGFPPDE